MCDPDLSVGSPNDIGPEDELIERVALAINKKWNEIGEVPFPLYQHEAEELAKAAIAAMPEKK